RSPSLLCCSGSFLSNSCSPLCPFPPLPSPLRFLPSLITHSLLALAGSPSLLCVAPAHFFFSLSLSSLLLRFLPFQLLLSPLSLPSSSFPSSVSPKPHHSLASSTRWLSLSSLRRSGTFFFFALPLFSVAQVPSFPTLALPFVPSLLFLPLF